LKEITMRTIRCVIIVSAVLGIACAAYQPSVHLQLAATKAKVLINDGDNNANAADFLLARVPGPKGA
jgi:hypothetical protein